MTVAPNSDKCLTIGQLAEQAGVSNRTVRYYEQLGILPTPERTVGGTRKYPAHYRFYLEGALALKELGFSLDEISIVGRLALGKPVPAPQRRAAEKIVREKTRALEHKIKVLARLHEILEEHQGALRKGSRARPTNQRLAALLHELTN